MWDDVPVAAIFAVLWVIGTLRGQATYWVARWVTEATADETARAGSFSMRLASWLQRPLLNRARSLLEGWGAPVITLSYLTVGLQTAILASAGVLRIRWVRFTIAQMLGAIGWAGIYTLIGASAWKAVLGGLSAGGWAIVLGAIAALMAMTYLVRRIRVRRRGARRGAATAFADEA